MVGWIERVGTSAAGLAGWADADEAPRSVLDRLDPPRRAAVLMALAAVALAGAALVALVVLMGWFVRRRARQRHGPSPEAAAPVPLPPLVPRDAGRGDGT
jgi:hypothetical protein